MNNFALSSDAEDFLSKSPKHWQRIAGPQRQRSERGEDELMRDGQCSVIGGEI
jgi:hypothetical protein